MHASPVSAEGLWCTEHCVACISFNPPGKTRRDTYFSILQKGTGIWAVKYPPRGRPVPGGGQLGLSLSPCFSPLPLLLTDSHLVLCVFGSFTRQSCQQATGQAPCWLRCALLREASYCQGTLVQANYWGLGALCWIKTSGSVHTLCFYQDFLCGGRCQPTAPPQTEKACLIAGLGPQD